MDAPSMVQRSGDTLIVRSVVSGNQLYLNQEADQFDDQQPPPRPASLSNRTQPQQDAENLSQTLQPPIQQHYHQSTSQHSQFYAAKSTSDHKTGGGPASSAPDNIKIAEAFYNKVTAAAAAVDQQTGSGSASEDIDLLTSTSNNLPQCKIKRNYSCNSCTYFTQNPRHFLTHLKDKHGEKIVINACRQCLYASRHYQKLVRHMKMVHGSTDGLEEQALSRKRASQLAREQKKRKCTTPQLQLADSQQKQHQLQLHIQNEYHLQMQQQHQQLLQQHHQHQLHQQHLLERSPEPEHMLLNDTQSIDSCSSSPEPPEPIVTLLDGPMSSQQQLQHGIINNDDDSPVPSGHASMCGDQTDNTKQLKCTLCEFSTYWRAQLVDHERVEHKLTQFYRCAKCTYVTHIKARYSKHVKYHSMPMIKCEMCDFRTPYKWNLDRHMKNHGGAGLYKCSACNFTADIKQSLTVHEMNHHVPPVGHASGMSMARRRNKVGGTDIVNDGDCIGDFGVSMSMAEGRANSFDADVMVGAGQANNNNNVFGIGLNNNQLLLQGQSSSSSLLTNIKLEAPADLSMKKTSDAGRKSSRPVPNLIPILGQPNFDVSSPLADQAQALSAASEAAEAAAALNITINNRNMLVSLATAMAQNDPSSANLPANATIQDLAALLFHGKSETVKMRSIGTESGDQPDTNLSQMSPASSNASSSPVSIVASASGLRRKQSANFFEEMKQKLATNAGNVSNLVCPCGHASKCLSERIIHQKQCTYRAPSPHPLQQQQQHHHHRGHAAADCDVACATVPVNLSITAGGSTRCQYCRHRCKSSTDLFVHMQNCLEVRGNTSNGESLESGSNCDGSSSVGYHIDVDKQVSEDGGAEAARAGGDMELDDEDDDDNDDDDGNISDDETEDESNRNMSATADRVHPMENRVFVWNNLSGEMSKGNKAKQLQPVERHQQQPNLDRSDSSELDTGANKAVRFYGIETAPGYGEVTQKFSGLDVTPALSASSALASGGNGDDDIASASLKKVFKCPHCSFWASTASRFHVHIVGHLNKKPFECSLCSYRSNWRWDITKHIRLKTIRDPSHKNARVLMNDETGRRNYTKYNKHITLMKVTEEDGDPKLLKSGEMTPSQEAALSFLGHSSSDSTTTMTTATATATAATSLQSMQTPAAMAVHQFATSSEDGFDSCDGPLSLVKSSVGRPSMPALISTVSLASQKVASTSVRPPATETDGKKTSFKCKKCNFRHSNRDVVLTHVKGHYHDAGIQLELKTNNSTPPNRPPPSASTATADIVLLPPPPPEPPVIASTALQRLSLPASVSIHLQPVVQSSTLSAAITPPAANVKASTSAATEAISSGWSPILLPSPALTAMSGHSVTNADANASGNNHQPNGNNENGEMDEASSLLGSSSVTGNWRDPAPYRCGHCHQVSNWKHVIQRHCRLKHNGDINIEFIEKGNKNGAYARLFVPGISPCSPDEAPLSAPTNHALEPTTISIGAAPSSAAPIQQQPPNQLIQLLNLKSRLYLCKHCFFSSPCRAQLDDHQKTVHPQLVDDNREETDTLNTNSEPVDDGTDAIGTANSLLPGQRHTTINQQIAHIRQMRLDNAFASAHAVASEFPAHSSESKTSDDEDQYGATDEMLCTVQMALPESPVPTEKCPHCPFETGQPDRLTEHMQYHRCVSSVQLSVNCDHCDYSVADERTLRRHVRLHFNGGGDANGSESAARPRRRRGAAVVRYFTRYEGLVLSSTTTKSNRLRQSRFKRKRVQGEEDSNVAELDADVEPEEEEKSDEATVRQEDDTIVIFPLVTSGAPSSWRGRKSIESIASGSSDKENKIIVDIRTGEVVGA